MKTIFSCIIAVYISLYIVFCMFYIKKYFKLKHYYGKENAKNKFFKSLKYKYIIPDKSGKTYNSIKFLLTNIGWNTPVEYFYFLKYSLAFVIMIGSLLITLTNVNLRINTIVNDLNYGRNITDYSVLPSAEMAKQESLLINETESYLNGLPININEQDSQLFVQAYIDSKNITYDSSQIVAKRVFLKLKEIERVKDNDSTYLFMIIMSYITFYVPNILMILKLKLMDGKKDWEAINCMTVYSVMGRLPPYKIDIIISSMRDISKIFKNIITSFGEAVKMKDKNEIDDILNSVDDEGMAEVFETLVLASEIGVNETVDNVDDLLENKIKWIEITSKKRRQLKILIAFIPVTLIMLFLFQYLIYGLNLVNQNMFIEI